MDARPPPIARLLRLIRARPRLAIATLAGCATFAVLPPHYASTTRALVTWDIGAGLYLTLAWIMFGRATVEHMRWRARAQDDGAALVLLVTVAGAIASLAAITLELSGFKAYPPLRQGLHIGLVALTFATSWLLVHTSFALHYAHAYYVSIGREHTPPLEFPRQEAPMYMDFLYFSMIIGMTSQTADVAITTTRMRRLAMAHGVIAFVFNTALLALTINIAGNLLG